MVRTTLTALTVLAIGALAACGASSGATSPTPVPTAVATPTPTAAPTVAPPTPTATAVATAIDPCALVTASEASQLAGATFGAGEEKTYSGNGKGCVYGANTLNVFTVIVAVASDASTAAADWATEESEAKTELLSSLPPGDNVNFNLDDVSNVAGADQAAAGTGSATISGQTLNLSAIFVLKGVDFFTFSDAALGHPTPTISAMETQAETTIGRLP
jgi:hypothetical protein